MAGRYAGGIAGLVLLALYGLTAAPDVTFWDAGEFATAFATLGVPHPPGTPLFVALGRAWTLALGALGIDLAFAANLFSAACTAGAGALTAALLARWTRATGAGVAAALCAGSTATVWLSATETEVYAAALLLLWLALWAADGAARRAARTTAAAYALVLAVPLHLSALAAAPAVALLAAAPGAARGGAWGARRGAIVLAVGVFAMGAGSGRAGIAALGAGAAVAIALLDARAARGGARARGEGAIDARFTPTTIAALVVGAALACSAALVLLVRARLDPALNQGNPSTWESLVAALARRQYAVAPLWPRQAPWWLQLGNLGQWADWQFALGLDAGVGPSWRRTPVTLAYAALGLVGAAWHRRVDPRGWRVLLVLLVATSVGVAAYLNLKAGPSYGHGVLPDGAPHEARERDYFFAPAFWTWGAWAGLGAWAIGARVAARARGRGGAPVIATPIASVIALAIAGAPVAMNWRAADRRHAPDASLAATYARAMLASAPPRAVLLVHADNDTYPLWFAQTVRGVRPDVTPVTVSLLGAPWYRAELARRHGLLALDAVPPWRGTEPTVAAIAAAARRAGRPVAASLALPPRVRSAAGNPRGGAAGDSTTGDAAGGWTLHGAVLVAGATDGATPLDAALARATGAAWIDGAAAERLARETAGIASRAPRAEGDGTGSWARRQLTCAPRVLAAHRATGAMRGDVGVEGAVSSGLALRGARWASPDSLEALCRAW